MEKDSSNDVEDLKNKHKNKMITEFTKFLEVYNQLSNSNYILDIRGEYDIFIRFLGNYIYKEFNPEKWDNTFIRFSDEIVIDLSLFKNTPYHKEVNSFLLSLKNAFCNSLDDDIYSYINDTKDYTVEEKRVCKEFYDCVSALNNAMRHSAFDSKDTELLSKDNITTYSIQLKEFNNYMHYVSSKRELYSLIQTFDKKIREIAKTKKYPEILFNV
jgi:hypothetical protein